MHIIFTGLIEEDNFLTSYLRDHSAQVDFVEINQLLSIVKISPATLGCADMIICVGHPDEQILGNIGHHLPHLGLSFIVNLADQLTQLPANIATLDGRKWNRIPMLALVKRKSASPNAELIKKGPLFIAEYPRDREQMYSAIRRVVSEYRAQLLDDLSNLGWIVTSTHGRYTVRPAFGLESNVETSLYYGPSDLRQLRVGQAVTIDRDPTGIQNDLEEFEALINSPETGELKLQHFFEERPYFLPFQNPASAIPHVTLPKYSGGTFIPDFILKPIVATMRDSNWEVLDLKKPQASLLAGPVRHRRFSAEVLQAIAQVRNYGDYFKNPAHSEAIKNALGHTLKFPKLGILIGRLPVDSDVEDLELAQSREQNVRVVTYDEILERQKKQLV